MQTIHSRRIIVVLLVATLLMGCEIHRRTIREYHTDRAGQINVSNVTEEQYWKERVDERIAAELAKEKPEAGDDTWQNYWRGWYGVLRRKKKTPLTSDESKRSEDLENYIKQQQP